MQGGNTQKPENRFVEKRHTVDEDKVHCINMDDEDQIFCPEFKIDLNTNKAQLFDDKKKVNEFNFDLNIFAQCAFV